jgi:hypothetical protein
MREESYTRQHLFVQVAELNGLLQNMSLTCDRYTNLQISRGCRVYRFPYTYLTTT